MRTPAGHRVYGMGAEYPSAAALYEAAKMVRDAGFKRWDVHSPFPIHGMDEAMGLGKSWLSAVVLEELHAGAGIRDREYVERMEHGFEEAGKILVPDLSDWIAAGKALARLALKYNHEKIGRSRLTNDALIAMSAARMGIHVITQNARDFQKLAEFSALSWQLAPL